MQLRTRRLLDRSFSGFGFFSIAIMGAALLLLLTPVFVRGMGAFFFKGTVEFRRFQLDLKEEKAVTDTYEALIEPLRKEKGNEDEELRLSLADDLSALLRQAEAVAGSTETNEDLGWMDRENRLRRKQAQELAYTLLMSHFDGADDPGTVAEYTDSLNRLHRQLYRILDRKEFHRRSRQKITGEIIASNTARLPIFNQLDTFAADLYGGKYDDNPHVDDFYGWLDEVNDDVKEVLGPPPADVVTLQAFAKVQTRLNEGGREQVLAWADSLEAWLACDTLHLGQDAALFENAVANISGRLRRLTQPPADAQDVEAADLMHENAQGLMALVDNMLETEPWQEGDHGFADMLYSLRYDVQDQLDELLEDQVFVTETGKYGRTRWDKRTLYHVNHLLYREEMFYPVDEDGNTGMGEVKLVPRSQDFAGTPLEPFFTSFEQDARSILRPRFTCYWRFLFDPSKDSHMLGGIWAEILGTFYLTLGAMLFAVPLGVIAAIYLTEYAPEGRVVSLLRTFISTLAGVPSIVFGLFGLAFFINTLKVSSGRSVLAGSMTLAILILPTIIRAGEEALRAVPHTYKEAALSLGAGKWRTITSVVLPAAMPGILTGIVISMGRAAGETAPIIFTAAISFGETIHLRELFTSGTRVLSWNIYNLASEHPAVEEIRHVQYGMVMVLIGLVVLLNLAAIILRARIAKKLRG